MEHVPLVVSDHPRHFIHFHPLFSVRSVLGPTTMAATTSGDGLKVLFDFFARFPEIPIHERTRRVIAEGPTRGSRVALLLRLLGTTDA